MFFIRKSNFQRQALSKIDDCDCAGHGYFHKAHGRQTALLSSVHFRPLPSTSTLHFRPLQSIVHRLLTSIKVHLRPLSTVH